MVKPSNHDTIAIEQRDNIAQFLENFYRKNEEKEFLKTF